MSVLILQHERVEGPGRIAHALDKAALDWEILRIDCGESVPKNIEKYAGLVLLGGPMGVYEQNRFVHLTQEINLIEQGLKKRMPILGICLGSQLLAAALGARVYPSGHQEIGWSEVRLKDAAKDDVLFRNLQTRFPALHWHNDIFDLPKGATSLASSKITEHQAYSYAERAWGILFHCEAEPAQVHAMADRFAQDLERADVDRDKLSSETIASLPVVESTATTLFSSWAGEVLMSALRYAT